VDASELETVGAFLGGVVQPEGGLAEGRTAGHGCCGGEQDILGQEDGEAIGEPRCVGHDAGGGRGRVM
jgi:hypothetical protein